MIDKTETKKVKLIQSPFNMAGLPVTPNKPTLYEPKEI